jgi:copper chaperone CopZ
MYKLKVEGMTCRGCTDLIEKKLKELDPEAEINIHLLNKEVQVQTVRKKEEVIKTLEESDFKVQD